MIANVSYLVYVSVSFHVTNNGGSYTITVSIKMNDPKTNYWVQWLVSLPFSHLGQVLLLNQFPLAVQCCLFC